MKYQLLKTSPYLGGQIRWDIPLSFHYDPNTDNYVEQIPTDPYWVVNNSMIYPNEPIITHVTATTTEPEYWTIDGEGHYDTEPTKTYIPAGEVPEGLRNGIHIIDTDELHIVPLDDSITYIDPLNDPAEIFNYTHLENIKRLASRIGGAMYSSQGEWDNDYWLYNNGDILDPYSHIFNMGARRMNFKKYNKQFSYLCPLWISEETDPDKLTFEISVKIPNEQRDHIVRRRFRLSDKVCSYMREYLYKSAQWLQPDPATPSAEYKGVSDDLLSINFDPGYASITGVNVDTGQYITCDISYLIPNILDREIPMIEFDNMLVSKFRESRMIAQQLINLNFAFNLEDISYILNTELLGHEFNITMRVLYDDNYIDIKDLYTNYTDLPTYRADLMEMSHNPNVCNYMGDDKIVDYIYTNKFTQPLFHWTLVENPIYIYNFYGGFAPTFQQGNTFQRVEGRYYDMADISQETFTVFNNADAWCRVNNFTDNISFISLSYDHLVKSNPDKYASRLFINKGSGMIWLNNNKYNVGELVNTEALQEGNIYLYSKIINPSDMANEQPGNWCTSPPTNSGLYIYRPSSDSTDIIMEFLCTDAKYSTFYWFKQLMQAWVNNTYSGQVSISSRYFEVKHESTVTSNMVNKLVDFLIDLYNYWEAPYRIEFNRSVVTEDVEEFDGYHPRETIMRKVNLYNGYVLRYTGKLCPLFIDPDDDVYSNNAYRYKQWGDILTEDVQYYNNMLKTGMLPQFPSLNYYSLEWNQDKTTRPDWYEDVGWRWEISWRNDSILYYLPEKYVAIEGPRPAFEYNDANEEILWRLLYNYIGQITQNNPNFFQDGELSLWMKHKLKELYKMTFNFDYASPTNIDEVIYYVRFDLR